MKNEATELSEETTPHAPAGFLSWVGDVVHTHRARLLAYARRQGLAAEDSLDAVQDAFTAFLTLPQARAIARTEDDASKMLTVLLRHDVMNRGRKRRRRSRADAVLELVEHPEVESSEALVARAEELARVNGCILRMALLQRRVVMLSLLDEAPREEVAEILGISDSYVRVLLHRAREHVRNCSFEYDEPNGD
jgi:RNA polymerase sigma-70 factor (ECF subfamily)